MTRNQLITTLISVLENVRKDLDPEMQAQQLLTLLYVAQNPGQNVRALAKTLKLSTAATSRNVAALGPVHRKGREGHQLVDAVEDLEDRRYKQVRLNRRGEAFIEKLLAHINRNTRA